MKRQLTSTIIAVFAALFVSLNSCTQEGDNITHITYELSGATEETTDFKINKLWSSKNGVITENVITRQYEGNKYIAYVGVKSILKTLYSFTILDSSYANGVYSYRIQYSNKELIMNVDARKDTIYIPNYYDFISGADGDQNSAGNLIGKAPFYYIESQLDIAPFTYELSKYNMKIFGGIDDAYIPLPVVNSLFGITGERYVYTGTSIISRSSLAESPSDFENTWRKDDHRPQELVELTYNMLRFNHDYIYGHPGYYGFADKNGDGYNLGAEEDVTLAADKMDFDTLIKTYAPDIYKALKSTSYTTYLQDGLVPLINSFYGDGHTRMSAPIVSTIPELSNWNTEDNPEKWVSPKIRLLLEMRNDILTNENNNTVRDIIKASIDEGDGRATFSEGRYITFSEDYKTAVLHFNSFAPVKINEWKEKYKNFFELGPATEIEAYPSDDLGFFYFAFSILDYIPGLSNIAIDITTNGGGQVIDCGALLAFLASDGQTQVVLTDQDPRASAGDVTSLIKTMYLIDLNLDGVIDEKDAQICAKRKSKYRIAIMTSKFSFSCGNLFPVMAKNYGFKIIGERSLGGSCSVASFDTADGFPYNLSVSMRGVDTNENYMNVENGAEVDAPIIDEPLSTSNLSRLVDFYDEEKIGKAIEKAYEMKE